MAVLNNNALVGASGKGGGALPQRSLRFNSADSSQLSRTPSVAGNRKTWTWSGWVKLCAIPSSYFMLFSAGAGGSDTGLIRLNYENSGKLNLAAWNTDPIIRTAAVYRDFSAWYHIVVAVDTANATASNRAKIYINGIEATYDSDNRSSISNLDTPWNNNVTHAIGTGSWAAGSSYYANAYIAHVHSLDGIAATPSDFAYTDPATGRWEPKAYAGSYSGNSFYLDFSDNSAATATTLGADRSGLGNNWVPNNFSVATGAGNNGNWRNKLSSITYYSGSSITQFDEHLFRGIADNSAYGGYSGYPSDFTWTPASPISYTSSVRFLYDSYPAYTKYTLNGGSEQTANGVWPPPGSGYQWQTVASGSGTLTSLRFRATSYTADIHAIEIDGVVLKDVNAAGNDSLRDHPVSAGIDGGLGGEVSGNYATLNPLDKNPDAALANGNLDYTPGGSVWRPVRATIGVTSGKWYWEVFISNIGILGIATQSTPLGNDYYPGIDATSYGYTYVGTKYNNGSSTSYGSSYTTGDLIGVAYDADNGKVWFSKNGTWQASGNPAAGTNAAYTGINTALTYFPMIAFSGTGTSVFNAGQRPFAYTAPSGFKALCDTNLPAPVIAKSDQAFQTVIWTGDGSSSRAITGLSFSPDLLWVKRRNSALDHFVWDSVRGVNKELYTNQTYAEGTASNKLTSFDTSGFTVQNNSAVNALNDTYVGWVWDAGSTTVTDNTGSTQSSRRTNTSTGLSIVTYSGNATSGATIGHGLGVAPSLIITKSRTAPVAGQGWQVGHASLGWTKRLYLETTNAAMTTAGAWNNTAPTSTVFTVGNSDLVNDTGYTYVAYCFAPVMGLSSFGIYQGNGSADGPFVFTGHRSRWVMVKRTDTTGNWVIVDTARDTYNYVNSAMYADSSQSESSVGAGPYIDCLSNGFKVRTSTYGNWNANGGTYIYCSFAESPFQYARAR